MTHTNVTTTRPIFTNALGKRMLLGAGLGLLMISVFVIGAGKGDPSWGDYWRVKPLLLTPFIGALVGLCYDVTQLLRQLDRWYGRAFLILSILGYMAGLWIGLILGLAGTMWD